MTLAKRIYAICCIVLAAGCAGIGGAPSNASAQTAPLVVDPSLINPLPLKPAAVDPLPATAVAEAKPVPLEAASTPAADTVVWPPAKTPAKPAAPVKVVEQIHKSETAAPAAKPSEPPLDVAALKMRLRETSAIGVFTKLALRNQMDDLLQRFRSHHTGGQKTGVAHLRLPYDLLVLKVLAVIQDGDPSLARTIAGSREAIWVILADPDKFKSVT